MAVNLSNVRTLVRYLLNDNSSSESDIFTYESSSVFTLSESNNVSISAVLVNDEELSTSEYSFNSDTNKMTINASLSSGDTIEIQYTCFLNYSNTEIDKYIRGAAIQLSINGYTAFEIDSDDDIHPEPDDREINLLAFITSIIIEPDNKSYRLPDMSISVPANSLATRDIISKAIAIFKKSSHGHYDILGI